MLRATTLRRLLCLAVLAVGWPVSATAQDPVARQPTSLPVVAAAAELSGEGSRTRLVVTLSRPVVVETSVMERPDRLILDFPEVNFQLPAEVGRRKVGLVQSFRYGLFAPGRSRMVIDLAQPALVAKVETSSRAADGATLLTVELARTEREAFRKAAEQHRAQMAAPTNLVADVPENDRRPLIVVDPGHGGVDPGARASTGDFEKDIVFAFATRLKKHLETSGRYRVMLTRREDVFVSLDERVRIAQAAKADLFLSVHADSISSAPHVRGLTVYTGAERATDAESARLAERENEADAAAGVESREIPNDVADILQELTQRETRGFSHSFATKLIKELSPVMRLNTRPHREARFRVLRAPDIPAVLVELGYLTSRQDIDLLLSDEWRDRSATAMLSAVDRFFATRFASRTRAPVSP